MDPKLVDMDPELRELYAALGRLHRHLRAYTKVRYGRINPFMEDLFDWKERGQSWEGCGQGVTIYNSTTVAGDVQVGENTWIGPYCSLDGAGGLRIGKHCSIALGCQLLTHDTVKWAVSGGRHDYEYASTSIGDYCFLGSYAVITKGVSVGDHSVVGAGAVVTKSVPDFSIAAGVPAKVVGRVEIDSSGSVHLRYFPDHHGHG